VFADPRWKLKLVGGLLGHVAADHNEARRDIHVISFIFLNSPRDRKAKRGTATMPDDRSPFTFVDLSWWGR